MFEEANFEDLWKIFDNILRDASLPNINCVLDGIDQCTGFTCDLLLQKFKKLFKPEASTSRINADSQIVPLRLMFISREDQPVSLKRFLTHFDRLRIEDDDVCKQKRTEDICLTVEERINNMSKEQDWAQDERLRNRTVQRLVTRSEGTYL